MRFQRPYNEDESELLESLRGLTSGGDFRFAKESEVSFPYEHWTMQ